MLIAVVPRTRVPIVGRFVLVLTMPSLLLSGLVAPPYHLNHIDDPLCVSPTFYSDYFYQARSTTYYIIRGGHSNSSYYCGAFSVLAGNVASGAVWNRGAALSFKLDDELPPDVL